MRRIRLMFHHTGKGRNGTKEHFWHFMLGYLLPSVHHVLHHYDGDATSQWQLVFDHCGPVMNPLTEEIANLFSWNYAIAIEHNTEAENWDEVVLIPRWDHLLRRSAFFLTGRKRLVTEYSIRKLDTFWEQVYKGLGIARQSARFRKVLLQTRAAILAKITNLTREEQPAVLLLNRSEMPRYYAPEGGAVRKGYGHSRRALLGLEEGQQMLEKRGVTARVFEPGTYSLVTQIRAFYNAKGIVAIRGAELANLLWLKPGREVHIINTIEKPAFHLFNYTCVLRLRLVEKTATNQFPNFKDFDLPKLLESYA